MIMGSTPHEDGIVLNENKNIGFNRKFNTIRVSFRSCRHVTCQDKNCNSHDLINKAPVMTKAMMRGEVTQISKEISTTTPSGALFPTISAPGLSITLALTSFIIILS